MKIRVVIVIGLMMLVASMVRAATMNGNDLALYLSESVDNKMLFGELVKDTGKNSYYFRYLEIMSMESGRIASGPFIRIKAMEPSSYWLVEFTVTKPISLKTLMDEPVSALGQGIGVTGQIANIDRERNLIVLDPVIVKHKDRLTPKRGKELIGEINPKALYYSFTGSRGKMIQISHADRDLLPWSGIEDETQRNIKKKQIQSQYTKDEWAVYLEAKLAERSGGAVDRDRDAAIRAGIVIGATNAPVLQ